MHLNRDREGAKKRIVILIEVRKKERRDEAGLNIRISQLSLGRKLPRKVGLGCVCPSLDRKGNQLYQIWVKIPWRVIKVTKSLVCLLPLPTIFSLFNGPSFHLNHDVHYSLSSRYELCSNRNMFSSEQGGSVRGRKGGIISMGRKCLECRLYP